MPSYSYKCEVCSTRVEEGNEYCPTCGCPAVRNLNELNWFKEKWAASDKKNPIIYIKNKEAPNNFRLGWTILFLIFTPISLLFAAASTGAGHGNFILAYALYPLPVLLMMGTKSTLFGIIMACIQFPIWAIAGYLSKTYKTFKTNIIILTASHMVLVAYVFIFKY